jgi:hypothetical protein
MLGIGARVKPVPSVSPDFFLTPVSVSEKKKIGQRKGTRILVLFSFLLVMFGGLFASGGVSPTATPKANAFFDVFCLGLDAYAGISVGSWPGASVATPLVASGAGISEVLNPFSGPNQTINDPYVGSGRAVTAYEWWGTAGQFWMINNLEDLKPVADCSAASILWAGSSTVANIIWQVVLLVGGIAILIYTIATSANILGVFLEPLGTVLKSSLDGLYLPFLTPMVMIAALWVAWVGLVKQRSTEAIQGVAWVTAAATFTIIFLSNPVFIAQSLNGLVGQIQTVIISTVNTGAEIGEEKALCYAGDSSNPGYDVKTGDGIDQASANSQSVISRQFQCLMWETFIFQPWLSGTFGELATAKPINTGAPPVKIADRELSTELANSFALQYLEARTENHDEVINRRGTNGVPDVGISPEILKKQIEWLRDCYAQPLPGPPSCEGATVAQQSDLGKFVGTPSSGGGQIAISFLALIAIIFGGIPIIVISVKLLFYQLMTVVMLMLAPIYLIVGIHPGFGRRVALGWLEYIVNVSIKRIALTFMIAILMLMIQTIMTI